MKRVLNTNDLDRDTIRIPIRLTVEVDPREWARTNGKIVDANGDFTVADVKADVRSWVQTFVQGSSMFDETGATVS